VKWNIADHRGTHRVALQRNEAVFTVQVGDTTHTAEVLRFHAPQITLLLDGHRVIAGDVVWRNGHCQMQIDNMPFTFDVVTPGHDSPASGSAIAAGNAGRVLAPLPGRIVEVRVHEGDFVTAGQALCVIEAMKMQNEICAPHDGTVSGLTITVGDTVEGNATLCLLS
jgi:biotin carboxyl carrier protein